MGGRRNRSVYLAGKIHPWHRDGDEDWRFTIVPDLVHYVQDEWLAEYINAHNEWSFLPKAILGRFDYVGPFFTDLSDISGGHGGPKMDPHGLAIIVSPGEQRGSDSFPIQKLVTELCLNAIKRADLIFAWIESPDCYGTLMELGYAKALGKQIACYLAPSFSCPVPTGFDDEEEDPNSVADFWFPSTACAAIVAHGTPREMFEQTITGLGWELFPEHFDSPLERAFAEEWLQQAAHLVYPLSSQYSIKNGKYRLDFAFTPLNIGIELDGYTYHSDREAFARDRQRQREIEALGWHIIRFSGDELRQDIARCVSETVHFLTVQHHRGL